MNSPKRNASRQRDAVLSAVRAIPGHPTADNVYQRVRRVYPRISLGTVYRNLRVLAEDGVIGAVENARDGAMVFDKMTTAHHHFICIECGAIIDVPAMETRTLNAHVAKAVRGIVLESRLDFLGKCVKCAARP